MIKIRCTSQRGKGIKRGLYLVVMQSEEDGLLAPVFVEAEAAASLVDGSVYWAGPIVLVDEKGKQIL